jgi:hypothetical protein
MKYIVEYIHVEGASCPGMGRLTNYIRCILKYIHVGGASCPGI